MFVLRILSLLALWSSAGIAVAQDGLAGSAPAPAAEAPAATIQTRTATTENQDIAARIRSIFSQIEALRAVQVRVSAGVVTLSGTVPSAEDVGRAEAIAGRVAGVVTVQNDIERDLDVNRNLTPALGQFEEDLRGLVQSLPLVGVALAIGFLIALAGYGLAAIDRLWGWIAPNPFLAELAATFVRFLFVVLGLIAALEVLGATALLGGVLGGAGVIGIALGFAMRDTIENYVASLVLSLRQPFRANDWVVIDTHEGRVVRLTSRATILITLDGNHLRIPNGQVFKSVILNYTRNPQRRFDFDLGLDADNDPNAARELARRTLAALPFVLDDPQPEVRVVEVGDSNIVMKFLGWIDQRETDWFKARSRAITDVKHALETAGFTLPEPIYRLRFDARTNPLPFASVGEQATGPDDTTPQIGKGGAKPRNIDGSAPGPRHDTAPTDEIAELVEAERRSDDRRQDDLLDHARPVE